MYYNFDKFVSLLHRKVKKSFLKRKIHNIERDEENIISSFELNLTIEENVFYTI